MRIAGLLLVLQALHTAFLQLSGCVECEQRRSTTTVFLKRKKKKLLERKKTFFVLPRFAL
jgi:hypothetical protein